MDSISDIKTAYIFEKSVVYRKAIFQIRNEILKEFRESKCTYNTLHSWHPKKVKRNQLFIFETGSTALNSSSSGLWLTLSCNILAAIQRELY